MQALAQQYRVIAEAGHISNLENSVLVTAALLEFLAARTWSNL
jgi:pimeloyl-ACP methyl ester carboxylesterase